MSPASKSKDRKAAKEPSKGSTKPSGHLSASAGTPASGYNPLLGTFHTFESAPIPSTSPQHVNGRFRNTDDTDDHSANGAEYDSASNNGSWSGESEEHKEKTSHTIQRHELVPGADNDKREKIRQKNERKHQRQKERRAQELHEKCCGYLMSRKLEALAHQLVAMGFSHERATMALILNEGRVEESVSWLFECSEEGNSREHNTDGGDNLKIDISEELAHIAELETRYQASKQEVERAIVASEGNLDKADEALKERKQEPPAALPKPEETTDPSIVVAGVKLPIPMALNPNAARVNLKSFTPTILQQRRDDRDFNYTKSPVTVTGSSVDTVTKNVQTLKKNPPKPQHMITPTDKRWTCSGSSPPVSYSLASPLQASPPPAKVEARFTGNELKNLQLGSVREPVIMMQRPQSINGKQVPSSNVGSSPPNWYSNSNAETVKPNGSVPPVSGSRSMNHKGVNLNPLYNQQRYQSQPFVSSNSSIDSQSVNTGSWSSGGTSPTIAPATNLGLFSRLGANGSSGSNSPVDWSTGGSMMQLDYASIDWSLDRGSLTSKTNGWWTNDNHSTQNNTPTFDSFSYGFGVQSGMRPVLSNRNCMSFSGLQDGATTLDSTGGGSREWTSPFEEKDIFSLPRQFVFSPAL